MRETSYLEKIIPFIVNMLDKYADNGEAPSESYDITGVKLFLDGFYMPEAGRSSYLKCWYSLEGSNLPETANIKIKYRYHWLNHDEPDNIGYVDYAWEFSAANNSLVASGDNVDGCLTDAEGAYIEKYKPDSESEEEVYTDMYAITDMLGDLANPQNLVDTAVIDIQEAEVTVNGKTVTVPLNIETGFEFNGQVNQINKYHPDTMITAFGTGFDSSIEGQELSVVLYIQEEHWVGTGESESAIQFMEDVEIGRLPLHLDNGDLTTGHITNDEQVALIAQAGYAKVTIGNWESEIMEMFSYDNSQE